MSVRKEWESEIREKMKAGEEESVKPAAVTKRCPQCHNVSLEYDSKTGRIYCTKCGFEEFIPMFKK